MNFSSFLAKCENNAAVEGGATIDRFTVGGRESRTFSTSRGRLRNRLSPVHPTSVLHHVCVLG
jgi:hypothetical protein